MLLNDHAAMLVSLTQTEKVAKPFRLFDSWMKEQEFLTVARTGLAKLVCGNGLFCLQ